MSQEALRLRRHSRDCRRSAPPDHRRGISAQWVQWGWMVTAGSEARRAKLELDRLRC
jgi:hypothetical protein